MVAVMGRLTGIDRQEGPFTLRVQLFDMKKAEVAAGETRADVTIDEPDRHDLRVSF